MSKDKKSGKKHIKGIGDITLNDFANATVCKNRFKKSSDNVAAVFKQLNCDKTWDEKEDFAIDLNNGNEESEETVPVRKTDTRRRRKTPVTCDARQNDYGNCYPIDIWYLIADYIRPEDVRTFAGICKTSFSVTCTAKFWFGLYKRYYQSVPNLPECLQPECMLRYYGLRKSVIVALYHMYPPFINRLKAVTTFEQHPDTLIRRQCVLMWYQEQRKHWIYYFKLKEFSNISLSHNYKSNSKQPDLIDMLEDISANPDEGCRILQITCLQFIAVPMVLGLTLKTVSLTLSQGFRYHRLQLGFGSNIQSNSIDMGMTIILMDPVINIKVLDWWHPLYPFSYNMGSLLDEYRENNLS